MVQPVVVVEEEEGDPDPLAPTSTCPPAWARGTGALSDIERPQGYALHQSDTNTYYLLTNAHSRRTVKRLLTNSDIIAIQL